MASQIDGTIDVTQVFSTRFAFAALRADGSVVTWGDSTYGGDSSAVASQINGTIDVTQVFSTEDAFAALRADGSVVTWGELAIGGDSSAVASQIDGTIDVTQVFSTGTAFAALRADGSVVTWGDCASWWRQQRRGQPDRWQHRRDAGVFDRRCLCRAARRRLGGDLGEARTMVATAAPWPARSMAPST